MSALLQGVPLRRADGVIYAVDSDVAVPDHFHNGLPYEANGALCIDFGGVVDHHHQGLPFNAAGRIVAGQNAPQYFTSGAAGMVAGRLAISNNINAIITHHSSGVGYSVDGRTCTVTNESPP